MCLNINDAITAKVRKRLEKGKARFWVLRKVLGGVLQSPFYPCEDGSVWRGPGVHKSSRSIMEHSDYEKFHSELHRGYHAFETRAAAAKLMADDVWLATVPCPIIVPVYGRKEDFIGAGRFNGSHSAVFTKLEITKADFDKAVGKEAAK